MVGCFAHGDVVALVGGAETTYAYDAFGRRIDYPTNAWSARYQNPFRYCGEYFDDELGTVYLRARYYDPGTGRFLSEDSVRGVARTYPGGQELVDPLSLNLYTYCHNNPVIYLDLSGNFTMPSWLYNALVITGGMLLIGTCIVASVVTYGATAPITATVIATSIGMIAGAGTNIAVQMLVDNKSFGELNVWNVITSAAQGGLSSALSLTGVEVAGQIIGNAIIAAGGTALKGGDLIDVLESAFFGIFAGAVGGNGVGYVRGNSEYLRNIDTLKLFLGSFFKSSAVSSGSDIGLAIIHAYDQLYYMGLKHGPGGSPMTQIYYYAE